MTKHTPFETPQMLINHLNASGAALGIAQPEGFIDHVIPQVFYNFNESNDVNRCWHPSNVRIVTSNTDNKQKHKTLDAGLLQTVHSAAFPNGYSKESMISAAIKDGGKDMYSQLVLSRGQQS